jgi:hypothetical protein
VCRLPHDATTARARTAMSTEVCPGASCKQCERAGALHASARFHTHAEVCTMLRHQATHAPYVRPDRAEHTSRKMAPVARRGLSPAVRTVST